MTSSSAAPDPGSSRQVRRVQAKHDRVQLSADERRAWAQLEHDLAPAGPDAAEGRPVNVAVVLLVVGLLALLGGAIAVSVPVVLVGAVLSLASLASAAMRS